MTSRQQELKSTVPPENSARGKMTAPSAYPLPRAVQQPIQARPEPPPAIEHHIHFHGLDPADVAAIIRQQEDR